MTDPDAVLLDSVTEVEPQHEGRVVVTGSHGGVSSGRYALRVAASLYVFNDAGIGIDRAGVAALGVLDEAGIAAVAVSHDTARIGEAADTLARGMISTVNAVAASFGLAAGTAVRDAIGVRA